MPRTKPPGEPVEIPQPSLSRMERNWGSEFRAAFIQARHHFGSEVTSYDSVAERVSQLVPTTGTSIMRLGYSETVPRRPPQRQIAYLAFVAMGFDPLEFGLKPEDRRLRGLTDIEIRKMLDPGLQASH